MLRESQPGGRRYTINYGAMDETAETIAGPARSVILQVRMPPLRQLEVYTPGVPHVTFCLSVGSS